ncbi:hypothetical protein H5410_045536 [Solanum commersonii]|uniref:Uncharacterized protein n=1 Tax=Solanum commersonii TaxID=4109 RepID=A0A9J5XD05_SOLCO|nr:hypothetical protein H5410_045536 [Solanum commersonii]
MPPSKRKIVLTTEIATTQTHMKIKKKPRSKTTISRVSSKLKLGVFEEEPKIFHEVEVVEEDGQEKIEDDEERQEKT